jgi:hypothetical protein
MLPFLLGVVVGAAIVSSKTYDREIDKILKEVKQHKIDLRSLNTIEVDCIKYDSRSKDYYSTIVVLERDKFRLGKIPIVINESEIKYYPVIICGKESERPLYVDKRDQIKLQSFVG